MIAFVYDRVGFQSCSKGIYEPFVSVPLPQLHIQWPLLVAPCHLSLPFNLISTPVARNTAETSTELRLDLLALAKSSTIDTDVYRS